MKDQHNCKSFLPVEADRVVSTDVIKCSSMGDGCGISIMRVITDSDIDIPETTVSMKGGESVTYRFAGSDYRVVRRIDDNAFLIKHDDDDQICWLDWEYENSAGGSGL